MSTTQVVLPEAKYTDILKTISSEKTKGTNSNCLRRRGVGTCSRPIQAQNESLVNTNLEIGDEGHVPNGHAAG